MEFGKANHSEKTKPERLSTPSGDFELGTSIIIPCFNDGRFLAETVASLTSLDIRPVEIIIINDGSDDPETLKILSKISNKVDHVIAIKNSGPSVARDVGISKASMPLILPIDADNIVFPEYFSDAIPIFANNPEIDVVYAGCRHFGQQEEVHRANPFSKFRLLKENYIDTCAFFRKSLWEKVGGFDPAMRDGLEDWEFWISAMAANAGFQHLDTLGFAYRVRSGSRSDFLNSPSGRDIHRELKAYIFSKHAMFMKEHYDIMFDSYEKLERAKSLLQLKRLKKLLGGLRGSDLK